MQETRFKHVGFSSTDHYNIVHSACAEKGSGGCALWVSKVIEVGDADAVVLVVVVKKQLIQRFGHVIDAARIRGMQDVAVQRNVTREDAIRRLQEHGDHGPVYGRGKEVV